MNNEEKDVQRSEQAKLLGPPFDNITAVAGSSTIVALLGFWFYLVQPSLDRLTQQLDSIKTELTEIKVERTLNSGIVNFRLEKMEAQVTRMWTVYMEKQAESERSLLNDQYNRVDIEKIYESSKP